MMKRCLILIILLLIIVFFVDVVSVSALFTCTEDQRILRLSDDSNAHGEIYNGAGGYPIEICYNDPNYGFGTYTGGTAPVCFGGNVVVRLSANSNAHAEAPGQTTAGYIDVCFGDLNCRSESSSGTCGAGEVEVLSLSSITNAHLEIYDEDFFVNPVLICCTAGGGGGGGFNNVEWQDFAGNTIGRMAGIESYVNNTVKLIAETGFALGTPITFDIKEDDGIFVEDIEIITGTTDDSGRAEVDWFISDTIMELADSIGEYSDGLAEFFFIASEAASGENLQSDFLDVNNIEGPDTPPIAIITGDLVHRGIYFTDVGIEFNHDSFDIEGPIDSVLWKVENNGGVEFTETLDTFTHTFTSNGQRTITLRVTDSGEQFSEDQIAIVVISSPGMIAYVNKPDHLEFILDEDENGDGYIDYAVNFSANDSYVIDYNNPPCGNIDCIAGNCPINTITWPTACSGPLNVVGGPLDFSNLLFDWNFNDGTSVSGLGKVKGRKIYGYSGRSVDFFDKRIDLTVTYDAFTLSESHYRIFTLGQCHDNGQTYVEVLTDGTVVDEHPTISTSWCAGLDLSAGTPDDCCTVSLPICTPTGCVESSSGLLGCGSLTNPTDCANAPPAIIQQDPLYNVDPSCENPDIECSCEWDANQNPSCGLKKTSITPIITNGECTLSGPSCVYFYEQTECINGFMLIDTSANYNSGSCPNPPTAEEFGCPIAGIQQQVPCGQFNIELAFFDWAQFVIALLLIFIIYFFIHIRKYQ